MNTGKPSEDIVKAFFARQGKEAFLHRVTDQAEVYGMNRGKRVVVKKQPADNVLTWKGTTHWLEIKSSENKTSFPLANISSVQLGSARMVTAAGGSYVFALHCRADDRWFWVPAQDLLHLAGDKSSVKWELLKPYKWNPYA